MSISQDSELKHLPRDSKIDADNLLWNMPLWIWTINGILAFVFSIALAGLRSFMMSTSESGQSAQVEPNFEGITPGSVCGLPIILILTLLILMTARGCNHVSLRKIWKQQTQSIIPKKMIVKNEFLLVLQVWGTALVGESIKWMASLLLLLPLLLMRLLRSMFYGHKRGIGFEVVVWAGLCGVVQLYLFFSRALYLFRFRFWSEPRGWLTIYFTPPLFARKQLRTHILVLVSLRGIGACIASYPEGALFVGPTLFLMLMSHSYFEHLSLNYYITDYRRYRERLIAQKEEARSEYRKHVKKDRNIEDETIQLLHEEREFEFEDEEW